jgi:two-component system, LytTR family, sensor kinase
MRPLVFAVSGMGQYDYGHLPARYAMEFWVHLIVYGVIVASVRLLDERRAAREREQRLIKAEAELNAARLRELEARLHPHFLFNALNTVSSVMYEDVGAADTMLSRLGDLLRRALATTASEIPLGEELETAQLWFDVMHARFGDRLHARIDVEAGVRRALVPPLLLQPLIENAVKHGDPGGGAPARIDISAVRAGDRLEICVRDNGPGLRAPADTPKGNGIGLDTTRKRLEAIYDGAHAMQLTDAEGGGLLVTIVVPWREGASHG